MSFLPASLTSSGISPSLSKYSTAWSRSLPFARAMVIGCTCSLVFIRKFCLHVVLPVTLNLFQGLRRGDPETMLKRVQHRVRDDIVLCNSMLFYSDYLRPKL